MAVMVCIAVTPIPVMCPAAVYIPPTRVISPIPRTLPCVPVRTPKPVVDNRSIDIYRFDDIVRSIYIFVADNLNGHIVGCVFLYVYRGNVLIDILGEDSLQNDESFVTLTRLYYAQVIHLTVSVEVEIAERAIWIVEHRLELLQVLSVRKKLSYNLQIESFRDVRTVGRNRDCFIRP